MAKISSTGPAGRVQGNDAPRLSEFVKPFEETFEVTAAAPVAVAAAPAGRRRRWREAAAEQDEFDVVLETAGDKKIQVIKEVRTLTSLGLKEAKDLVDGAPKTVLEKVAKEAPRRPRRPSRAPVPPSLSSDPLPGLSRGTHHPVHRGRPTPWVGPCGVPPSGELVTPVEYQPEGTGRGDAVTQPPLLGAVSHTDPRQGDNPEPIDERRIVRVTSEAGGASSRTKRRPRAWRRPPVPTTGPPRATDTGSPEGDAGGRESGASPRTPSRLSALWSRLLLLLLVLLAGSAYLWAPRPGDSAVRSDDYVEALQAARSGVVDMTSFDHLTLDDDIEQIRRVSTGDLREEAVDELDASRQQITDAEAVINTEVVGAG